MNPEFPPSLDRLFRIVRRTARADLPNRAQGVYTEVEAALREPNLEQAIAYYEGMYANDDAHGTEVIFASNLGDFHVLRINRPQPKVELIAVRVA